MSLSFTLLRRRCLARFDDLVGGGTWFVRLRRRIRGGCLRLLEEWRRQLEAREGVPRALAVSGHQSRCDNEGEGFDYQDAAPVVPDASWFSAAMEDISLNSSPTSATARGSSRTIATSRRKSRLSAASARLPTTATRSSISMILPCDFHSP